MTESTAPTTSTETVTVALTRATITLSDQLRAESTALAHVDTKADADRAGLFLRTVRAHVKQIKDHYLAVRRPMTEAVARIREMEKADLAPWEAADAAVAAPLLAWKIADDQRIEAENRARREQAVQDAEAVRAAHVATLRAAAAAAETKTAKEQLERQARQVAKAAPVVRSVPKEVATPIAGVTVPKRWGAEVTDLRLLCAAIGRGEVPEAAVLPNMEHLDRMAVDLRHELRYPGVVAVETPGLSSRR